MAAMEFIKKSIKMFGLVLVILPLAASPALSSQTQAEAEQFRWPPSDVAATSLPAAAASSVAGKSNLKPKPLVETFMVTSPLAGSFEKNFVPIPERKKSVESPVKSKTPTRILSVEALGRTSTSVKIEAIVSDHSGEEFEVRAAYALSWRKRCDAKPNHLDLPVLDLGGAQVLLHGHTHVPRDETDPSGVRWLNPGCITRPNRGAPASFAWLTLEPGKPLRWELVKV